VSEWEGANQLTGDHFFKSLAIAANCWSAASKSSTISAAITSWWRKVGAVFEDFEYQMFGHDNQADVSEREKNEVKSLLRKLLGSKAVASVLGPGA
jgi:hypothetical protein